MGQGMDCPDVPILPFIRRRQLSVGKGKGKELVVWQS